MDREKEVKNMFSEVKRRETFTDLLFENESFPSEK